MLCWENHKPNKQHLTFLKFKSFKEKLLPKLGDLVVVLDNGDNADSLGDDFVNPPNLGVIKAEAAGVFLLEPANK